MTVYGNDRINELISKGHVTGLINSEIQVQPNGLDLTVGKIEIIGSSSPPMIDFDNKNRKLPRWEAWSRMNENSNIWELVTGTYKVTFNEHMKLPEDICAIGRPRSSLLRMGCTVETAIIDAGFMGKIECMLVVGSIGLKVERNARLIQVVFMDVEGCSKPYKGAYSEPQTIDGKGEL